MRRERHGKAHTSTYTVWSMMKQRCYNPAHKAYARYGGRGIVVCDRWRNSFAAFLADMGERPGDLTLDRINNDGPYAPENCRWATRIQQGRNMRNNRRIEIDGRSELLIEVVERLSLRSNLVYQRLHKGWSIDEAIGLQRHIDSRAVTVHGETMTLAQWAKRVGISRWAMSVRLRNGWTVERACTTPRTTRAAADASTPAAQRSRTPA